MKLFNLHRKSIHIEYQNHLCSFSTFIIGIVILLSLLLPYYVIRLINPGGLWERHRLVYEQPDVKFTYQYLFLAEVGQSKGTGGNGLITCSSFESYNELTEERQECNAIKVTTDDSNMDGKLDTISASVSFNMPEDAMGLAFYTFYFFLEAELKSNCHFTIPTIVSLSKVPPPTSPFTSGRIIHRGHLKASQSVALQCPFFMRNIKSHFNHNYIPNENFTSIDNFLPESILDRIESSNAAHFRFEQQRTTNWRRDGSEDVAIQIDLLIGGEDSQQTALLYNTSLWQKVAQFWMQYFPVLLVFIYVANKVKDWLFESYTVRAMEVLPWKEKKL